MFTIGEIAYMDADGYVYITDRFSDMVVSGGVNIYPAEAEQVLIEHPGVADVACIGVPHKEMGEELKGLVIPADPTSPPDPTELLAYCRERLSHYKCPRTIDIVADLGRNAMGKVNKRALRVPVLGGGPIGIGDACVSSGRTVTSSVVGHPIPTPKEAPMSISRRHLLARTAPAAVAGAVALPLLAAPTTALAASGPVTLIAPFRLQDSRINEPDKYDTSVRDSLADPSLAGHAGAVLNVTVTETEGAGFFRFADAFQDPAATSNINWWGAGQTLANLAVVSLTASGGFVIQGGGGGRAHLVIDVLALVG